MEPLSVLPDRLGTEYGEAKAEWSKADAALALVGALEELAGSHSELRFARHGYPMLLPMATGVGWGWYCALITEKENA